MASRCLSRSSSKSFARRTRWCSPVSSFLRLGWSENRGSTELREHRRYSDRPRRGQRQMTIADSAEETPEFLRDPDPREVHYTVISVDDHLIEPPEMFDGRMPKRFEDR